MANLQPLRNYIRQNIAQLRSKPCLLISSSPPPVTVSTAIAGTKSPSSLSNLDEQQQKSQHAQLKFQQQQTHPKVHAFVERNVQSLTMEFNLHTVPCHVSSAFPTLESVKEAISLAKRAGLKEGTDGSGDGVVIGIGSGAAMDLAKAVSDSLFGNVDSYNNIHEESIGLEGGSLVLAPCTLGGLWAASSNSPSILLDTKEEMLLPHLTSSWNDAMSSGTSIARKGTVVSLDPARFLVMPPLYAPFHPVKRSEFISSPSMAHVAAAALTIILDVARTVDAATKTGANKGYADVHTHVLNDMKSVASSCATVLELAALEAKSGNDEISTDNSKIAQTHLLDAIPRLSQIVEQSSLLSQTPTVLTGTMPQKMANALIPAYFPQCHLITYLACILPALCEVLSQSAPSGGDGMVEAVATSIIDSSNTKVQISDLTMKAGIPTMAGLAYGTPDLKTLVGSLDSYDTLITSLNGSAANGAGPDEHWVIEDVLQRSLNR